MDFSSLNPYQTLATVEADSPSELVSRLRSIQTPIKILSIVSVGQRQVAYIMGDVRTTKSQEKKKGK